jgi:large subunit ribosomal protein L25
VSEVRITAEPRTEFGKGAARRVRRADKVPAVLYGHGTDPRHVSLPGHELMLALAHGANQLLTLDFSGGDSELALPRAITRDPIKGHLVHVDLLLVRRGEKVSVEVPVVLDGEIVSGGLLDHQLVTLNVEAEATHIPSEFHVSVDGFEVGRAVHAKDVALPAGVTLLGDPEAVVVHVIAAPTAEQVEAELAEAEAEVGIEKEPSAEETSAEGEAASGGAAAGEAPAEGEPAQAGAEG